MTSSSTKRFAPTAPRRLAERNLSAAVARARLAKRPRVARTAQTIAYRSKIGVDDFVRQVAGATPMQIVAMERDGVVGTLLKDLAKRMDVPASRLFGILGVPKATAEKKASERLMVTGSGGQAAIGMVKLLAIAEHIVAESTAVGARDFDAGHWLGRWIERSQPALGGRKPAELLDTPTGLAVVTRLLGAIESGSYQ